MSLPDFEQIWSEVEEIMSHPNGDSYFKQVWAEIRLYPEETIPNLESLMESRSDLDELDKTELRRIAYGLLPEISDTEQ